MKSERQVAVPVICACGMSTNRIAQAGLVEHVVDRHLDSKDSSQLISHEYLER